MQAAHTVCTYAPPYHQRCWILNWTLITRWKISLLFSPEDTASVISNKNIRFGLIDHFSTLKQSILNEPWPTGHNGASGPCSHMAFFLHDRALVGICRWHTGLCLPTVVSGSIPGPMSMKESCWWVMQCPLRARRTRASNKGLRPCSLRTEISPVSLNLLMMLCTVDDEICKAFALWCWRMLFLKYSTIFLRTLSQIGEPLPIFTSETLRHPFYS